MAVHLIHRDLASSYRYLALFLVVVVAGALWLGSGCKAETVANGSREQVIGRTKSGRYSRGPRGCKGCLQDQTGKGGMKCQGVEVLSAFHEVGGGQKDLAYILRLCFFIFG